MTSTPKEIMSGTSDRLIALIDRISRLTNSEVRSPELNPAQHAALAYLQIANRFSRKPSLVAEYLSSTRGTVSQTLKALERKDMVEVQKDAEDGRSISYRVTSRGHAALAERDADAGLELALSSEVADQLEAGLAAVLEKALSAQGHRSFGICRTCQHHDFRDKARHCKLLDVPLNDADSRLICAEHALADAE